MVLPGLKFFLCLLSEMGSASKENAPVVLSALRRIICSYPSALNHVADSARFETIKAKRNESQLYPVNENRDS